MSKTNLNNPDQLSTYKKLKETALCTDNLSFFTNLASNPLYKKIVITKILTHLQDLDISISCNYEYTDEQEWTYITSNYQTPCDKYSQIKNDIKEFLTIYKQIPLDTKLILSFFNTVNTKTKYLQFILFSLPETDVLSFLYKNSKRSVSRNFFLMLLFSFVIRKKTKKFKFEILINDFGKESDKLRRRIYLQNFLYASCFDQRKFADLKGIIDENMAELKFLNSRVVGVFGDLFGYNIKTVKSENELLSWFPFDTPKIDDFMDLIEDDYVVFNKE